MKKALIPTVVGLILVCGTGGWLVRSQMTARAKGAEVKVPEATVSKGTLVSTVVEKGTVEAERAVEVKSRVSGRLAKLFVKEGDSVTAGQIIAIIDPQETELMVKQNAANLRGAQSNVQRTRLELAQRRQTTQAAYEQTVARLKQLEAESSVQPTLLRSDVEVAETALKTALEERERLTRSAHPQLLIQAQQALDEATANFENADRELKRQQELEAKGFAAGRAVENAALAVELARVRREAAVQNLGKTKLGFETDLSKANEQIRQAQASLRRAQANRVQPAIKAQEIASARASVDQARAAFIEIQQLEKSIEQGQASVDQLDSMLGDSQRQLRETEIRAPISGVVTKKLLEVGELASGLSGFNQGTGIVRIEDRNTMQVKLAINEIDTAKLKVGMEAKIDVDALPRNSFKGRVKRISPASTAVGATAPSGDSVVRYEVVIGIDDVQSELRSGMSARCSVDVVRKQNVLLLPIEFVDRTGVTGKVDVVSGTGPKPAVETRIVDLGDASGSMVEVLKGLSAGDKVRKPSFSGPARKGFMQAGPDDN